MFCKRCQKTQYKEIIKAKKKAMKRYTEKLKKENYGKKK